MIVSTQEQVRRYLPSYNFKVGSDRLADFLERAQEWVTDNIIGTDIESALEEPVREGQADPHDKLRTLTSRVICEHAFMMAAAEMDLQLSEAGFVVQSNDHMSPASQQRVDRLLQSLNDRLGSDCDALVKYLLKESAGDRAYSDWRGTEEFAFLTQSFTPTMSETRQNGGLQLANWESFLEALPRLSLSMRTTVAEYVSLEQVESLLEMYRDGDLLDIHRRALRPMKMAAIADVAGLFDNASHFAIEARGLMMRHQADFPEFVNSDRFNMPDIDFGDGAVANML